MLLVIVNPKYDVDFCWDINVLLWYIGRKTNCLCETIIGVFYFLVSIVEIVCNHPVIQVSKTLVFSVLFSDG